MASGVCYALRLERIGGATQDFLWFGTIKCRAWVAAVDAITGTRRFLRPVLDYRAANQKGTRGVYATYILKPGEIYEVANPTSWYARICEHLGMEPDEVLRLRQVGGLADLFAHEDFSEAWEPI